MGFLLDVFTKIAKRMGLQVQYKEPAPAEYKDKSGVNLTATIANRVTTLTMLDSTVEIRGESARAKYLKDFAEYFTAEILPTAAEVSLGTGDCLMLPWTDGERVGVSIIQNDDFRICDSIGGFVKSVIIRAEKITIQETGRVYERFEGQRLDGDVLTVTQYFFCDSKETAQQNCPAAWRDIEPLVQISGCSSLMLGRIKCPTVNRGDINSPNGVRITYGLDGVMDYAVKAYNRFNDEMEKKETMLFADRTLFTADKDGNRILPKGKAKLFQAVKGKDGGGMVQEYSPEMRTEELDQGIEVNFRMLEMLAGLDEGIITKPATKFATATEIKASLQLTFAFMTKFRAAIMAGTDALFRAVDVLCNLNGVTPAGEWETAYDWSSSYVESLEEQFNRLVVAEGIGAVSKAEVRAYVMDEEVAEAEGRVDEIGRIGDAFADE